MFNYSYVEMAISNLNSDAEILQIFCNPVLQTQNMKTSRGTTPMCYTFLENSYDP